MKLKFLFFDFGGFFLGIEDEILFLWDFIILKYFNILILFLFIFFWILIFDEIGLINFSIVKVNLFIVLYL